MYGLFRFALWILLSNLQQEQLNAQFMFTICPTSVSDPSLTKAQFTLPANVNAIQILMSQIRNELFVSVPLGSNPAS